MGDRQTRLVNLQKLLNQLKSDKADERYEACEELRVSPELPDFAIEALREAMTDSNHDVQDAAQRAFDLHTSTTKDALIDTSTTDKVSTDERDLEKMYKSIRSWAILSVVIGGLSLVSRSVLDPVWGIVLIATGVMSWRIKIPQMYIIYSVIMFWAGVTNGISVLMGSSLWWLVLAVLQVFLTLTILRDYQKYRRLPEENFDVLRTDGLTQPQYERKIIHRFTITSFILAIISTIVMSFTYMGCTMVFFISEGTGEIPEALFYIGIGAVNLAVLALGLSISAVLSKTDKKGMAIASVVLSSIVLIGYIGTILIFTIIDNLPTEGISNIEAIASSILNI
jgi:hypothetical protein